MPQDRVEASHFSPDIQEFIQLLHKHGVHYLIVGGEAVIYYGYARLTGDVDFFSEEKEIPLYYLSRQHLIKNKQAAGRPKDLEDLAYLRRSS